MLYKVKNLNGTSDSKLPAGYSSCLDFWEKILSWDKPFRSSTTKCHNIRCNEKDNLNGAHVKLVEGGDEWYIVPLCTSCNTGLKNAVFSVDGPLVPVEYPNYPIKY